MKSAYNPSRHAWDRFRTFYSTDITGGFFSFATGEVAYLGSTPDPELRRYYPDYNTTIVASTDRTNLRFIHPTTGDLVPKAQLSHHGITYLIVDHETKQVRQLAYRRKDTDTPSHLQAFSAYTLADGGSLHTGSDISIYSPSKYTAEELEWINTVAVLLKLDTDTRESRTYYTKIYDLRSGKIPRASVHTPPHEFVTKLHRNEKAILKSNGVQLDRHVEQVEYLLID